MNCCVRNNFLKLLAILAWYFALKDFNWLKDSNRFLKQAGLKKIASENAEVPKNFFCILSNLFGRFTAKDKRIGKRTLRNSK